MNIYGLEGISRNTSFREEKSKQDVSNDFMNFVEEFVDPSDENPIPDEYLQSGDLIISPKLERKMREDPELAEKVLAELEKFRNNLLDKSHDEIIIVNREGEVTCYSTKKDDRPEHPTPEELKEVAKARARKKARLDAYFHLLERVCIKRKIIEQENAKRGKRYRKCSVTKLNCIVESRQTPPPKDPDYYNYI